ncbi:MAG: hypothetical protein WBF52_16555, partial [Geitlerinemataceae cyanobacterium]
RSRLEKNWTIYSPKCPNSATCQRANCKAVLEGRGFRPKEFDDNPSVIWEFDRDRSNSHFCLLAI